MKDLCCVEGGLGKWLLDSSNASKEVLLYARIRTFVLGG